MLHERGRVDGDVVVQDRTVLRGHRLDVDNLERLVFEFSNSAREDIVGFALEFGSGADGALFRRKSGGIEAVGMSLTGRVFGLKLYFGTKRGDSFRLVVEPARRGD